MDAGLAKDLRINEGKVVGDPALRMEAIDKGILHMVEDVRHGPGMEIAVALPGPG